MYRFIRFLLGCSAFCWAGAFAAGTGVGTGTPAIVSVALTRHDAGTFYVRGAIDGYGDLDLLVDTGASYLVINETILSELKASGLAKYSRELRGTMADGSARVIPVYRLQALRLGAGCWIPDVEAAVFPGNSRPILGMNVLGRLSPFTFSAEPPQLALAQCRETLPIESVGVAGTATAAALEKSRPALGN